LAKSPATFERFEMVYRQLFDGVKRASPLDAEVSALAFIEEACENSGTADHMPEWLGPFAGIVGRAVMMESGIAQELSEERKARLAAAIGPALAHAIRLGYTEGYFEAKSDG